MVKKKPVEQHKVPVRLHLDRVSVGALNRWAGRDNESVSNVVRGLIRRELSRESPNSLHEASVTVTAADKKRLNKLVDPPKAQDWSIDNKLEKTLRNSPILVTANLLREFRFKDDTDGLPRVSLPGGNFAVVWSKLLPILEYCLTEKTVAAFFYEEETRFELVGGKLGSELHWWEETAAVELEKQVHRRDFEPLQGRPADPSRPPTQPMRNVRPATTSKFVVNPDPK